MYSRRGHNDTQKPPFIEKRWFFVSSYPAVVHFVSGNVSENE